MFPLVVRRTLESDDDALMQVKYITITLTLPIQILDEEKKLS